MEHRYGFSVLVATLLIASPAGGVLIDAFEGPEHDVVQNGLGVSQVIVNDGGVIATERDVTLEVTAIGANNQASVTINQGASGVFSQNHGAGVDAFSTTVYDGVGSVGLGVDLTEGGDHAALELAVTFDDLPCNIQFTLVDGSGNSASSTLSLPGAIILPANFLVLYSSFSPTGLDFTDVESVTMVVSGSTSLDVSFDLLGTTAAPTPIEETTWTGVKSAFAD